MPVLSGIQVDQSFKEVIVFAIVPLLLVLCAVVLFFIRSGRRKVTFPAFSLDISSISHETALANYRDVEGHLQFYASPGGGGLWQRKQIRVRFFNELSGEEIKNAEKILSNLTIGLQKLGYHYWIYDKQGTLLAENSTPQEKP